MNYIQENCCFCVKELDSNHVKIQDCGNDNITYISKLKYVFQDLIIPPHMYLPISICSTCCGNLNQAYEFKEHCFRSLNYWGALGAPETELGASVDTTTVKTEADPLSIENTEVSEHNKQDSLNTDKDFTLKSEITVENDDGTEEYINYDNLDCDNNLSNTEYILNFGSHFISTNLTCDFCQATCENVAALKEHLLKHHPNFRIYECETCGRNFNQEGRLKMHSLVHTNERNFECDICHNKYKTKHILDRHVRQEHTKEKKVNKCEFCGLICKTKSGLYYHTQKKHKHTIPPKVKTLEERNYVRKISYKTKELLHPCHVCNKRFVDEKALGRHMRIHSKYKPHKCEICGKGFVQSSALKGHLSSHTDERNYKCTQCSKTFKSQGHLTTHMDIHMDRVHTCAVCNKTFANLSSYYTHKKTHRQREVTEDKKDPPENVVFVGPKLPHACETCPKSYFNHIQLRKHKLTHTLTKKFVCSNCGKCFISLGALKAHLLTHTKEKSYACGECGKKFKTELTLKIHKQKVCKKQNTDIKPEQTDNCESRF